MSHDAISGTQFKDYKLQYHAPEMGQPYHRITAHQPGDDSPNPAGEMRWNARAVKDVFVDPAHQRRGIATAMWEAGQQVRPRPKHSDDRTDAGDAWAKKVGGPVPRRRQ